MLFKLLFCYVVQWIWFIYILGMMIESMAGKSASLEGTLHDATPFVYSESNTAISYFGECLKKGKKI